MNVEASIALRGGVGRGQSHLAWMEKVYPYVVTDPATQPMECMQNEGDIMYVPEGW